jgi:hypothetical protein
MADVIRLKGAVLSGNYSAEGHVSIREVVKALVSSFAVKKDNDMADAERARKLKKRPRIDVEKLGFHASDFYELS